MYAVNRILNRVEKVNAALKSVCDNHYKKERRKVMSKNNKVSRTVNLKDKVKDVCLCILTIFYIIEMLSCLWLVGHYQGYGDAGEMYFGTSEKMVYVGVISNE